MKCSRQNYTKATKGYEAFQVDSDDENETDNNNQQSTVVRFIKNKPNQRLQVKRRVTLVLLSKNAAIDKTKGDDLIMIDDATSVLWKWER